MESELPNLRRTEEVDHIVNRMPQRFGFQITAIAASIILTLLLLGFWIAYPDVQLGTAAINTKTPAIKIFSTNSGKIILEKENLDQVMKGDVLGYLDNSASMDDIFAVGRLIENIDVGNKESVLSIRELPKKVYLGSINSQYYVFLNALQQYQNHYSNNLFDYQISTYNSLLAEQHTLLEKAKEKAKLSRAGLDILDKFAERDSILLATRIISMAEFERNKMTQLNAVFSDVSTGNEATQVILEIFKTQNVVNEIRIKKEEVQKNLDLSLSSSFQELNVALKQFDETYVFRSPQDGNLQYLSFWNNNFFVKAGEPVFSIVPPNDKVMAQVLLPNAGAGKVEKGHKVVIKLDNFPYNEYGSLEGVVEEISLVTNTQQTAQGEIESYMVNVFLPKGLMTNYGKSLAFKYELKGTAEIITKNRSLIERVFDNIQYILSEKANE